MVLNFKLFLVLLGFLIESRAGKIYDFVNNEFTSAHKETLYNAIKLYEFTSELNVEKGFELIMQTSLSFKDVDWIRVRLPELATSYGLAPWLRYNFFWGFPFADMTLTTVEARQNGTEMEIEKLLNEMVAGISLPSARIKLQTLVNSFVFKSNIQGVLITVGALSGFAEVASWIIRSKNFEPRNDNGHGQVSYSVEVAKQAFNKGKRNTERMQFPDLLQKYQNSPEKQSFIEETSINPKNVQLQTFLIETRSLLETAVEALAKDLQEWEFQWTLKNPQILLTFPEESSTIPRKLLQMLQKLDEREEMPPSGFVPKLISELKSLDYATERVLIFRKIKVVIDCAIAVWKPDFRATLVRDGITENKVDSVLMQLKRKAYSTIMQWNAELAKAILFNHLFPFANYMAGGIPVLNLFDGSHVSSAMSNTLVQNSMLGFKRLLKTYRSSTTNEDSTIFATPVQYEDYYDTPFYSWSVQDFKMEIQSFFFRNGSFQYFYVDDSHSASNKNLVQLSKMSLKLRASDPDVDLKLQDHLEDISYEWIWVARPSGDYRYQAGGKKYLIVGTGKHHGMNYAESWPEEADEKFTISPYTIWKIQLRTPRSHRKLQEFLNEDISLEMYGRLRYINTADVGALNLDKYYKDI